MHTHTTRTRTRSNRTRSRGRVARAAAVSGVVAVVVVMGGGVGGAVLGAGGGGVGVGRRGESGRRGTVMEGPRAPGSGGGLGLGRSQLSYLSASVERSVLARDDACQSYSVLGVAPLPVERALALAEAEGRG